MFKLRLIFPGAKVGVLRTLIYFVTYSKSVIVTKVTASAL